MQRINRAVVLCGLVAQVACAGLVEVASAADDPGLDATIEQLLQEDASLSDLVERDPALLETLRSDPAMVARLAGRSTLYQRTLELFTNPWVLFGLGAQFMFMMRFLIQWIASERRQRSHVPVIFWYFSVGGGVMLLTYAIQRRDPVFILGQSLGLLVYSRNLMLIYRRARTHRQLLAGRAQRRAASGGVQPGAAADPSPAT